MWFMLPAVVVASVVVVEMVVVMMTFIVVEHVQSSMPLHNFVPLLMSLPSLEDHGVVVDSTVEKDEFVVGLEEVLLSVVVMLYQQQHQQ